jgi:hypothetical protein
MRDVFIGYPNTIQKVLLPIQPITHVVVELPQGLHGLFLGNSISEAIHRYKNNANSQKVKPFDVFNSSAKSYLENVRPEGNLIYVETDYFGGVGSQSSGVFKDGQLMRAYFHTDEREYLLKYAPEYTEYIENTDDTGDYHYEMSYTVLEDIDETISRSRLFEYPINKALRKLGVVRDPDKDEFATLGLGDYRSIPY